MNKLQLAYQKYNEFYTALELQGIVVSNQKVREVADKYVEGSIGLNDAIVKVKEMVNV